MYFKKKYLAWVISIAWSAFPNPTQAQQYFTNPEGKADIHFIVSGELVTASTDRVEIIYNVNSETLWISFQLQSFQMENKKLSKKLFKKNEAKFTIMGNMPLEYAINTGFGFGQFSFVGRVFNKEDTDPVVISGRVTRANESGNQEYKLSILCGVESKWFGQKFLEKSEFPVVNIHITNAALTPMPMQRKLTKN